MFSCWDDFVSEACPRVDLYGDTFIVLVLSRFDLVKRKRVLEIYYPELSEMNAEVTVARREAN